jgi:hypothetical protein
VLLETATGANKQPWATISCKHCERAGRYEITVPDNKVRLDAVQALLHEALGRPAQAQEPATPRLPESAAAIASMSWQDMQYFAAALLVDELATVQRDGGEAFLRERVAELGDEQRRLLREALA